MNLEVKTSIEINGHTITTRQLEVLSAVAEKGSKTSAAKFLGISPPVVHKYIASMEDIVGESLLESTPAGSTLTEAGKKILNVFNQSNLRCDRSRKFTVACSPVTEDLLMSVLSALKLDVNLIISDNEVNLRSMNEGLADMAIIDDPMYLFEAEQFLWKEIGTMGMVHVDNGSSYIRYRFGAQRIAYMYLDSLDVPYSIDAETFSLSDLLASNRSFFVDEFLLLRKGIRLKSAVDPRVLRHTITAVYHEESKMVNRITVALLAKHLE